MENRHYFTVTTVVIIIVAFFLSTATGDNECVYTVYVKTGPFIKSGTDSTISLTLADSDDWSVSVSNLEKWGLMGPEHNYYERGNLDVFSGRGPCLGTPLCRMNLTSDGAGKHHGWYCDYIEVTSTGPHTACAQTIFYVDQWLAIDAPPYELSVIIDGCHKLKPNKRLVVGQWKISV